MYDRPTASELIDAARLHMETAVIPAVRQDRQLYFRTLVAINVLKIVGREMTMSADHMMATWARLNALLDDDQPLPAREQDIRDGITERNADLCAKIRNGDFDEDRADLFAHLKADTYAQLEVANPRFLAQLAAEDDTPEMDAWNGR